MCGGGRVGVVEEIHFGTPVLRRRRPRVPSIIIISRCTRLYTRTAVCRADKGNAKSWWTTVVGAVACRSRNYAVDTRPAKGGLAGGRADGRADGRASEREGERSQEAEDGRVPTAHSLVVAAAAVVNCENFARPAPLSFVLYKRRATSFAKLFHTGIADWCASCTTDGV